MKIDIDNYLIESDPISGFNLYRKSKIQTGNNKGNDTLVTLGYNKSIEGCVKSIAHENIHNSDLRTDLNGFVKEYRKEVERIEGLIG